MPQAKLQQDFEHIIKTLPEPKLQAVIDFATFLIEKEEAEEFLKIQSYSRMYLDWIGPENDIYDELFKNEIEEG